MRNKVLIIADSFPTISKPSIGSFYLEHTAMLMEYFDIRVIVLEARERMVFSYYLGAKYENNSDEMDQEAGVPVNRIRFNRIRQNRFTYHFLKLRKRIVNYNFKTGCSAVELTYLSLCKTDFDPDLILAETAQYMAPFAVFLGEKYNKPIIGYEHFPPMAQMTTVWEMDDLSRPIIISSLNRINRLLSVSQYLSNVLFLNRINIRISNIGNGVDENLFNIKARIQSNYFYVTYIGYVNDLKDPTTMFECIRTMKNLGETNIIFRLINGVNDFLDLTQEYKVEDVVENMTDLSRSEVIKIITEQTDVLVSTSTSETFGLAMLEALMSGVPVIATNSGGNQEFLSPENSLMIENKNSKALVESILKIKEGEVVFERQYLRDSVVHKYGVGPHTSRFVKHLEEVIETYQSS